MINYDKLQALLKEKGISQSFISEKIGMSRNYIKDCKRLKTEIPEERLNLIADILGTATDYLTDETDDPAPKQKVQTSWRDMDMSIEKRKFIEELDKLSDEQILDLSRIVFPIIDEIKANRKEKI